VVAWSALILVIAALLIWWRFDTDIKLASARTAQGSVLIATRCGPIEYQEAGTGAPLPPWVENTMLRLIGSDFLFWTELHVARSQVIKVVLATPPELLPTASPQERARVNAMLDHILPVSVRAEGFRTGKRCGQAPGAGTAGIDPRTDAGHQRA